MTYLRMNWKNELEKGKYLHDRGDNGHPEGDD